MAHENDKEKKREILWLLSLCIQVNSKEEASFHFRGHWQGHWIKLIKVKKCGMNWEKNSAYLMKLAVVTINSLGILECHCLESKSLNQEQLLNIWENY